MSFSFRARQDREAWLALLLLLVGVLFPAAGLLWFTNRAASHEAEAARREVVEAYQGQLRLLRDRIDARWRQRAEELSGARSFHAVVTRRLADSAVVFGATGGIVEPVPFVPNLDNPELPKLAPALALEAAQQWELAADLYAGVAETAAEPRISARAMQAQIRCLIQIRQVDRALALIEQFFVKGPGLHISDTAGRRIAADEMLLAISLLPDSDRRRQLYKQLLAEILNDYAHRMPSAQRLFLMNESQRYGMPELPSFQAERLAARFLESDQPRTAGSGLQATNVSDVWKLPSSDGRMIALFHTHSVEAISRSVLEPSLTDARFTALPPGVSAGDGGVPAGRMLPGWQLSVALTDTAPLETEARRRRNLYLWTGYLAITGLVAMWLLLGRSFRRQARLARLKTDLVAAVSHELKTPLASMRLLTDALLERETFDTGKTREYLTLIAHENHRLTRLIENFLTFARIEQRRMPFNFTLARPETIVEIAVTAVRERFQQNGSAIEVYTEPDLPALCGDPDALATALINLLDNAFKYTPADKRVAVRVYRQSGLVTFAVVDNGVGIPRKLQKRIFRGFYQVDQSLARTTGGCGLGLSIVKYIVVAHHGSVTVASRPGEGSTFTIALPELSAP